ncbi:MAG: Nramp family divalent metal transporter, partial [Woeseiales bacterium]
MSEPTTDNDSFDSLELPSMTPGSLAKKFGPGMMLMMTGIGTSHLITAPVAGGRYGYALLWCLPIAYIFKYYGFEMAIRFTHATGRSMLDAYATAWKKIPVWYVLITTVIQSTVGQAGRLIAAAAVVFYFFRLFLGVDIPGFDDDKELAIYAFLLAILSVTIILRGRYAVVELVTKIAAGILIVCTLSVFIVQPAPVSEFVHFFQLETPEGSWLLIASFLGLLPTGIDVSLQASEWGKAKKVGMGRLRPEMEARGLATRFDSFESSKKDLSVDVSKLPSHAQEYCRRWFKIGLIDFRFGHVISFILATIFLMLAAVWLYPSDVSGNAVMGEIAKIFTESVGPSLMIVFLAGALAATFSTAFNYFDGWPRVVGACCRNLFRKTAQLPRTSREELDDEQRKVWYSEYN